MTIKVVEKLKGRVCKVIRKTFKDQIITNIGYIKQIIYAGKMVKDLCIVKIVCEDKNIIFLELIDIDSITPVDEIAEMLFKVENDL